MALYLGKNRVCGVVTVSKENLDTELNAQETLLNKLEEDVNSLSDKPQDMLQAYVDTARSCEYLFYKKVGLDTIDFIKPLDTSNVYNMAHMFDGCRILDELDLSHFKTNNVTNMSWMFSNCAQLMTFDLSSFDTSKVTDMSAMFYSCLELTGSNLNISSFDTSAVTTMSNMFYNCARLDILDLSNFNTSLVTDMSYMFWGCNKLTSLNISSFNTSSVTTMTYMFYGCKGLVSIDLSNFDTSSVTDMAYMFKDCIGLQTLDLSALNFEKVSTMGQMFNNCSNLTAVNFPTTAKPTNISAIFGECRKLKTINGLDMINCTSTTNSFMYCNALENVFIYNIKKGFTLATDSYNHLITVQSLIHTMQQLWDLTGSTSQTLRIGNVNKEKIADVYVKLIDVTDEMLAQDQYAGNKKPCVVCEPTDEGAMTLTEYATSKNWAIA